MHYSLVIYQGTITGEKFSKDYVMFEFNVGMGSSPADICNSLKDWCKENLNEDQYEISLHWPPALNRVSLYTYDNEAAMAVKLMFL